MVVGLIILTAWLVTLTILADEIGNLAGEIKCMVDEIDSLAGEIDCFCWLE